MHQARGQYIARMDADDIALPLRLEKQIEYLEKNKETVAIGGQCLLIDKNGNVTGKKTFPREFKDIYKYIFYFIPLQQPTLMINTNLLPDDFEYYKDGMNTAEEVELIFKLFQYGKVENVNDWLLMYRIHETNTSLINIKKTFLLTLLSRIKAIYAYNYRPDLGGIIVNFAQALLVMLLPRTVTFFIYKALRSTYLLRSFPLLNKAVKAEPAIA